MITTQTRRVSYTPQEHATPVQRMIAFAREKIDRNSQHGREYAWKQFHADCKKFRSMDETFEDVKLRKAEMRLGELNR